jgi:hypothetical protein
VVGVAPIGVSSPGGLASLTLLIVFLSTV